MVLAKALGACVMGNRRIARNDRSGECSRMNETSYTGLRVAVIGRLAAMSRQELQNQLAERGLFLISDLTDDPDWIVFGEYDLAWADDARLAPLLGKPSPPEVISESELWRRLGLIPPRSDAGTLFTPAMIADLVKVPVREVRRWHRLGLLTPVQVVHRLPYFDYEGLLDARRLAQLRESGISAHRMNKLLANLCRAIPRWRERFRQLALVVSGRTVFFQSGNKLIDHRGQLQLNFDASDGDLGVLADAPSILAIPEHVHEDRPAQSFSEIMELAELAESRSEWEKAAELYRAALAIGGPNAEVCFRLADVLYQMGDLNGARERYFMAVELDEDYIEARLNLGSVLAELGHTDLAISAYRGTLATYPDYADAHLLLARLLDDLGQHEEAVQHWQRFIMLAPESPWVSYACDRLAASGHGTSAS